MPWVEGTDGKLWNKSGNYTNRMRDAGQPGQALELLRRAGEMKAIPGQGMFRATTEQTTQSDSGIEP
jgi:hypothetical protein